MACAAGLCFGAPASRAEGNAPWCAVMSLGTGEVYWDCEYYSVEQCVPHVLAGNRGFCNPNPDWRGTSRGTVHRRYRRWHSRRR